MMKVPVEVAALFLMIQRLKQPATPSAGQKKTFNERPQHFQQMLEIAMEQRFTWKAAAGKYVTLYRKNL